SIQRIVIAADQVVIALHRVGSAKGIIGIPGNIISIAHQQVFTGAVEGIGSTHYCVVFRAINQGITVANHLVGAGGGIKGIVIAIDTVVIAINGIVIAEYTIGVACDGIAGTIDPGIIIAADCVIRAVDIVAIPGNLV